MRKSDYRQLAKEKQAELDQAQKEKAHLEGRDLRVAEEVFERCDRLDDERTCFNIKCSLALE